MYIIYYSCICWCDISGGGPDAKVWFPRGLVGLVVVVGEGVLGGWLGSGLGWGLQGIGCNMLVYGVTFWDIFELVGFWAGHEL